jgi:hypothetical protein
MASGLPLVAPNTGGVISYANAQNAWTVNADVISFAGALEQIAANRQLRLEKIGNALATAQHYRWETVAATFLDLYEMLTRATNAKPETLPGAAFQSTSAAGLRATIMHGVSQMAARGFRLASRFAPEPQSRRRQVTTDLMGSS